MERAKRGVILWTGSSHRPCTGFTITELLTTLCIIGVLGSLAYPVIINGSRKYQLIQCLGQMRKVGRASIECLNEGIQPQSMGAWVLALDPYGIRDTDWMCPARRHDGKSKRGDSDFMYAGARAETVKTGDRLGELYLWVEKLPNHEGLHVCAMGDGRVTAENLLNMDF